MNKKIEKSSNSKGKKTSIFVIAGFFVVVGFLDL